MPESTEIHGFSQPDAAPTPWPVAEERITAAETFWISTGQSDLADGALDIVLEGVAEQVADDAELEPVAAAFAAKYGRETWDYSVRDGAFDCGPPTRDGATVWRFAG